MANIKSAKKRILTSEKNNISKLDIQKFNKEYPVLEIAKLENPSELANKISSLYTLNPKDK